MNLIGKKMSLFFTGLFCGVCLGLAVGGFIERGRTTNERELGKIYSSGVAHRIRTDIRVLELMKQNDLAMAIKLLKQDVQVHASSLLGLKKVMPIGEAAEKAIKDAGVESINKF